MADQQTYAVTGVASGIGAELARILKTAGHRVIGLDIHDTTTNVDRFIPLDLNDPASIIAAAAALDEPIDGLCNNAGLPPRDGMEQTLLQVNFLGQRQLTQALLPCIKPGGAIVNMASRAGHGWPQNVDQIKRLAAFRSGDDLSGFITEEALDTTRCYNLSKEAIILWTQAITEQLFPLDIRAVSLSPGGIATGIFDDFRRAFGDAVARNVARAGRPGNPEEVAQVAAFALSRVAYWLKGTDIAIDGGMGAFNLSNNLCLQALQFDLPEGVA